MARVIPNLQSPELALIESAAERTFYTACREQLPNDWTVLFSTPWVGTTAGGRRYDGEADFVIFVNGLGMLVVEVKGGGVAYDPESGIWVSTDRYGQRHRIKDPFRQATAEKHQLISILRSDHRWARAHPGRLLAGHAIMLADIDRLDSAVSVESPREILGGRPDFKSLQSWVEHSLLYWAGRCDESLPISVSAIDVAERILHGRVDARPLLSSVITQEERVRIKLTEQQSRVLRGLATRRRAAVCGGAGTGKTILAMEKARQLAAEVGDTLLLCYNNLLADHIKTACQGTPRLYPMSFHELCHWRVSIANRESSRDLLSEAKTAYTSCRAQDYYDLHLPYALTLATEILPERYDAIVIDEGQDFRDEYWLPVEWLLRDSDLSHLYVFFDQNQAFYTKASTMPIVDLPFVLTLNCRNTMHIHRASYRYFRGDLTDGPEELQGVPVTSITGPTISSQTKGVHAELVRLLDQENVKPHQIAILICGEPKSEYYASLASKPLPASAKWVFEGVAADYGLRVDTVRRFKGIEADIVFLWGLDSISRSSERELLYVGISRAKSRLICVGTTASCAEIVV